MRFLYGLGKKCQMVSFRVRAFESGLAIEGELDVSTVPVLRKALEQAPGGTVPLVDLAGMSFVDSAGLQGLLSIVRSDPRVRLVNPTRAALRVMVVAGLERDLMNA
jgi:anti-anti-sigma factor